MIIRKFKIMPISDSNRPADAHLFLLIFFCERAKNRAITASINPARGAKKAKRVKTTDVMLSMPKITAATPELLSSSFVMIT